MVNRADVLALRAKVELIVDPNMYEASCDVTLETTDGQTHHVHVEHAVGSLERPMSNEQLKAKFVDQSEPILGAAKTQSGWEACMSLGQQANLDALLAAMTLK